MLCSYYYECIVAYAENFHGAFIQWHMVAVCIWCALFVTSQFDVIFMFPNQRFAKCVDTSGVVAYLAAPGFCRFCRPHPIPILVNTAFLLKYFYERCSQCKNPNACYVC